MSVTPPADGAGKSRVRLADLVRGHESNRPKTAKDEAPKLLRLVRPSRQSPPTADDPLAPGGSPGSVTPPDASEQLTAPVPLSGPGAAPSGDLRESKKVFHRAVATAEEVLQAVRARAPFSVRDFEPALAALLESLQTSDALLLPFFSPGGGSANPAQKVVRVCILALKLGIELSYSPDALRTLGLAALLHEAGAGRIQKDGAQPAQALGATRPGLSEVRNRESHEQAQVVGLASLFEDLAGRRPARSGFWPSAVIKDILQRERGTFPDQVLKALIRVLATIPVGCLVRLNTDEICRVVAKNDRFLLRPVVAVLVRRGNRLPEPTPIDLSQNPFLHIQGFVTEEMLDQEVDGAGP